MDMKEVIKFFCEEMKDKFHKDISGKSWVYTQDKERAVAKCRKFFLIPLELPDETFTKPAFDILKNS